MCACDVHDCVIMVLQSAVFLQGAAYSVLQFSDAAAACLLGQDHAGATHIRPIYRLFAGVLCCVR
jgi:hypothetical protein